MLNVPAEVIALCKSDNVKKNFRIHFPDGEFDDIVSTSIVQGSIKFSESVCSRDVLRFGLSEQSSVEFETVGIGNMYGKKIQCFCELDATTLPSQYQTVKQDVPFPVYSIPYGDFVVTSCPRSKGAMQHREVEGYSEVESFEEMKLVGIHSNNRMRLHPDYFTELRSITTDDMEEISVDSSNRSRYAWGSSGFNSGNTDHLIMSIVNVNNPNYFAKTFTYGNIPSADQMFVINVHYDKDVYDGDMASKMYKLAADACPTSTSFLYDYDGDKVWSSTKQAFAIQSGMFKPFYRVDKIFSGSSVRCYGYPHTIEPDTNILIDWYNDPVQNKPSAATNELFQVRLLICIPNLWYGYANWRLNNTEYDRIENWPSVDHTQRSNISSQRAYIKVLDEPNPLIPFAWINSTLKTNIPVLGTYYMYENAFSPLKFYEGYLELTAQFARFSRTGGMETVTIPFTEDDPPQLSPVDTIPLSKVRDLWFDEYEVSPVGAVRYRFSGLESTVEYTFGDGESVYDMTDNYFLEHLDYTTVVVEKEKKDTKKSILSKQVNAMIEAINGVLDTYFIPKMSILTFIPVDLDMMGLPYLQAGDVIAVEYEEGQYINTIMLRRELRGEMTLKDRIVSKGGEIIDDGVRLL